MREKGSTAICTGVIQLIMIANGIFFWCWATILPTKISRPEVHRCVITAAINYIKNCLQRPATAKRLQKVRNPYFESNTNQVGNDMEQQKSR
jgi:hypothetical protein